MQRIRAAFSIAIVITVILSMTFPASAAVIGCPEGQAIRGIDLQTRRVVCVTIDAPAAPENGAVAWARVNADGTMDVANSYNVVATSRATNLTNYYCIDVAVPFKNIQVTVNSLGDTSTGPITAAALVGDPYTSCGPFDPGLAIGDVTVHTFGANDTLDPRGTPTPAAFYILFH
jgi:hypothetical protein